MESGPASFIRAVEPPIAATMGAGPKSKSRSATTSPKHLLAGVRSYAKPAGSSKSRRCAYERTVERWTYAESPSRMVADHGAARGPRWAAGQVFDCVGGAPLDARLFRSLAV